MLIYVYCGGAKTNDMVPSLLKSDSYRCISMFVDRKLTLGGTMNSYNIIGIDLSKKYLQVHEMTEKGKILVKKKFTVNKFKEFITNHAPAKVAMESCSTSHYWGKLIEAAGHEVKLLPAQHVKPFAKRNKDDAADAEGYSGSILKA